MTNKNSSKMEVPQAGSIGGEMVRQMIKKQEESMK